MFIGQDADNVLCCFAKLGGVGDFWGFKVLWEELDCVCVPDGYSGGDVAVVTSVMVEVGANVPTVDSMC